MARVEENDERTLERRALETAEVPREALRRADLRA